MMLHLYSQMQFMLATAWKQKVLKVNDGEGQVILTYKRLAAEKGNKRLRMLSNLRKC